MTDSAPSLPLEDPVQTTWRRPTKRGSCGRNPQLGPGSCTYWWEGCPRAEARGCHALWRRNALGDLNAYIPPKKADQA